MWKEVAEFDFDLIVDDELYNLNAAVCLFQGSADKLKENGIYAIEGVGYREIPQYRPYFHDIDFAALYVTMFGGG